MSTSGDFVLGKAADSTDGSLRVERTMANVTVEITRPADVIAYSVGDSVNTSTTVPTAMTFAGMGRASNGEGYLVKAMLMTDQAACVAQMRLWLFTSATPFLSNDNAAFLIKYVDRAAAIGYIDFPALATEAGSDCAVAVVGATGLFALAFQAGTGGLIYGVLETKTAFTPASGQKFFVRLVSEQE